MQPTVRLPPPRLRGRRLAAASACTARRSQRITSADASAIALLLSLATLAWAGSTALAAGPARPPAGVGSTRAPAGVGSTRAPYGVGPARAPATVGPARAPYALGPARAPYTLSPARAPYALGPARAPYALGPARAPYAGGEIVVGYENSTILREQLKPSESVSAGIARVRRQPGVRWAVPDYLAHATGTVTPDDPGLGNTPGGWQALQWNFAGPFGVDAPEAWFNAASDGSPGGRGVIVAVLDTGVAYANHGNFHRSPDFSPGTFVPGYDFIARDRHPYDRNGHGTFVAGTIAEATNNGRGLTGLAWGARIMPVRVLDDAGEGDASVIAEGIRYAVGHHARIINLSLEFSSDVRPADIPELIDALRYARRHRVIVVAAAGNEDSTDIPYPARGPAVIAVGASTEHGCLAAYSNHGPRIALVAPGGGPDANLPGDPNCHPELPAGRDIYQMTFTGTSSSAFGFPSGYEGTSMATPHVSATVALMLAGKVLGGHPTPHQVLVRLKTTARPLGSPQDRQTYGAGLLDAAAATAP